MAYKVSFDIGIVGNGRESFDVVNNINQKEYSTYEIAKSTMQEIFTTLKVQGIVPFTEVGFGVERHCIVLSLSKVIEKDFEELIESFFVELDENLDITHKKELKN